MNNKKQQQLTENHKIISQNLKGYVYDQRGEVIKKELRKGTVQFFLTKNFWQYAGKKHKGDAEAFLKWLERAK